MSIKLYFSDFFEVSRERIEEYGALDVSLINDLPLFIDPFLLFNSVEEDYKELHEQIIKYVAFLRDESKAGGISPGLLKSWFYFPEVKQNWFGYSKVGNNGSGLGKKFAESLNENLHTIFTDFGNETITRGSHLEKLCLIKSGVGRDNISDFTTNLIKKYLCEYTECFCKANLDGKYLENILVERVEFNYNTRSWVNKNYILPVIDNDFVILTPRSMLTKDEAWINQHDMVRNYRDIAGAIDNDQLREQLNDYLHRSLPDDCTDKEFTEAVVKTIYMYPEYIDHYIRQKEDTGDAAIRLSNERVKETESMFILNVENIVKCLVNESDFYSSPSDTFEESYQRVLYLKQVIENNDGYRLFYHKGQPIKKESDLQLMFRLTWFGTPSDINSEVNNGRGPVDYKASRGAKDSTLVEFKLAKNTKLKQNLKHQVKIYENANNTKKSIKVILYFSTEEYDRVKRILKELGLKEDKELVLIDAQKGNKQSASNVKDNQLDLL